MAIFNTGDAGLAASSGSVGTAGRAVYKFPNVVEPIGKGDFITLDTGTGTIQRANDYQLALFAINTTGVSTPPADTAIPWSTSTHAALIHVNADGTQLILEGAKHNQVGAGSPQLIKLSADGLELLKTINLPSASGGQAVLAPLSGNRLGHFAYLTEGSITITVYDANTLALIGAHTRSFTGGSTGPLVSGSEAIETGNGQIVLNWAYGSARFYAVLNADFTVKTHPVSAGPIYSSYTPLQRLKLSNGRVVIAASWMDSGSTFMFGLMHFDQNGNFANQHSSASQATLMQVAHAAQINDRAPRYFLEAGVNRIAFCFTTSQRYFRCIDIETNTLTIDTSIGDGNHELSWCQRGDYAYLIAIHNSGTPANLKSAVFNTVTGVVKQAVGMLIPSMTLSYGLKLEAALMRGNDEWWVLGTESSASVRGNLFWWCFTIKDGGISVKVSRTAIAGSQGVIQDIMMTDNEAAVIHGGNSYESTTFAQVMCTRINLKTGALINSVQLRTHATGNIQLAGMTFNTGENKLLFRASQECYVLFGLGASGASGVLSRLVFKPNASILLGIAESDSANGEVSTVLSGWCAVSGRYSKFQKTIDHSEQSGNKAKTYGSAAYLTGSF